MCAHAVLRVTCYGYMNVCILVVNDPEMFLLVNEFNFVGTPLSCNCGLLSGKIEREVGVLDFFLPNAFLF